MGRLRIAIVGLVTVFTLVGCAGSNGSTTDPDGPASNLTLLPTGIGIFDVGLPADEVIEGVSAQVGGPDADSADRDDSIPIPDCGIPDVRIVSWGSLILVFAGDAPEAAFVTWSYGFDPRTGNSEDLRQLGLVTDTGVGLGTLRPDVERIYGSRLDVVDDTVIDLASFAIDGDESEHLGGRFPTTDPNAPVQYLERVPTCTF